MPIVITTEIRGILDVVLYKQKSPVYRSSSEEDFANSMKLTEEEGCGLILLIGSGSIFHCRYAAQSRLAFFL